MPITSTDIKQFLKDEWFEGSGVKSFKANVAASNDKEAIVCLSFKSSLGDNAKAVQLIKIRRIIRREPVLTVTYEVVEHLKEASLDM